MKPVEQRCERWRKKCQVAWPKVKVNHQTLLVISGFLSPLGTGAWYVFLRELQVSLTVELHLLSFLP